MCTARFISATHLSDWNRFLAAWLVVTFMVLAAGCDGRNASRVVQPLPIANSSAPDWVYQSNPPKHTAIVFVHGIFGDARATWTNANGTTFFDLVHSSPHIGGAADIYAFGFTSKMFAPGSLTIQEAANKLHMYLNVSGVRDYEQIVFVAHSMGGLVVLRELLTNREVLRQVPLVMLYATPQEGAQIAMIARNVVNNDALNQMLPADRSHNDWLAALDSEWKAIDRSQRPLVECAYEKKPTAGVVIVPYTSATRFCDHAAASIAEDHLGIVKPDSVKHDSFVALLDALNRAEVTGSVPKLETPDFVKTGENTMTFTLSDPFGKRAARLVNAGRRDLRYTLAEFSDSHLYVWPEDTPKFIPKGATENVRFALGMGAIVEEYSLVLRVDGLPDQRVLVKVSNLQAAMEQHSKLAKAALERIDKTLASNAPTVSAEPRSESTSGVHLDAVPSAERADAKKDEIVAAVRDAVRQENPNLPKAAQYVLAADILNSAKWSDLALRALDTAKSISAKSVDMPSVKDLARVAREQTSGMETATELPSKIHEVQPREQPGISVFAEHSSTATAVAEKLQSDPDLRRYSTALGTDVRLHQP